jgi:hypothetical protein
MKYILSLAVILAANLTFAKTAAQLDQTQDIKIQIENQTGIQLQNLVLKPQFSCWTTDPEGGGEAGTSVNEITVPFSYDVSGLSTSVINATVKIEGSSRGEAPKKRSFFSSSRCGAGVLLVLQEKAKVTPRF